MKLDKAFITQIDAAVSDVWQEIGSDLYACCAEQGEELTNEEAIESVLDADRMTTFGHPEADALVSEAIKEHGYSKVAKFIGKNISLA